MDCEKENACLQAYMIDNHEVVPMIILASHKDSNKCLQRKTLVILLSTSASPPSWSIYSSKFYC
jgi:hypothetical protein